MPNHSQVHAPNLRKNPFVQSRMDWVRCAILYLSIHYHHLRCSLDLLVRPSNPGHEAYPPPLHRSSRLVLDREHLPLGSRPEPRRAVAFPRMRPSCGADASALLLVPLVVGEGILVHLQSLRQCPARPVDRRPLQTVPSPPRWVPGCDRWGSFAGVPTKNASSARGSSVRMAASWLLAFLPCTRHMSCLPVPGPLPWRWGTAC
mmetsp:Transcript_5928/g.36760  ORF Transcript_5928/g.36760 Transcript_5928/m.36760 type:complete len:203 (+) Transcript_5928:376-984(+)